MSRSDSLATRPRRASSKSARSSIASEAATAAFASAVYFVAAVAPLASAPGAGASVASFVQPATASRVVSAAGSVRLRLTTQGRHHFAGEQLERLGLGQVAEHHGEVAD